jgi:hypothetical protein
LHPAVFVTRANVFVEARTADRVGVGVLAGLAGRAGADGGAGAGASVVVVATAGGAGDGSAAGGAGASAGGGGADAAGVNQTATPPWWEHVPDRVCEKL